MGPKHAEARTRIVLHHANFAEFQFSFSRGRRFAGVINGASLERLEALHAAAQASGETA
jgi:hypothetical protein